MAKTGRFNEAIYADFHEGFNDSVAEISISDTEVCVAENVVFSEEVKSFKTRKGTDSFTAPLSLQDELFTGRLVRLSTNVPPVPLAEETYSFLYNGTNWRDEDGNTVTLSDYGVSIQSGTPYWGDRIGISSNGQYSPTAYYRYGEANVTDCHVWFIGSKYLHFFVMGNTLYRFNKDYDLAGKVIDLSLGATRIYPFVEFNKFYFGDGKELYVIGDYDFSSEQGTVALVRQGQIVRNNHSTTGYSELGHFYKAARDYTNINLQTTAYNFGDWDDVTEVPYFASNVCRTVVPHDPSESEIVWITVVSGSTAAGTVTIYLDNTAHAVSVGANATINTIVDAIKSLNVSGWTSEKQGNTVIFTKNTAGLTTNGYVDPGTTGCVLTYTTEREGKINDNNLDPIKKCTMFAVHQGSHRVFATGNPDDNAVYYSEIGQPTYFKSDYNKLYPENKYGKSTGLLQISESILVSFENGWYAWSGINALDDAKWKPISLPYGCVNHRTIALTPYSFTYLGKDGIYTVSASILNTEVAMVQGRDVINKITGSRVEKAISKIYDTDGCTATFYDNTYYLAYNTEDSFGHYNNRVLKYEWETKSFSENTGWQVNAWCSDGNGLYFATRGDLLVVDVGTDDWNVDVPYTYKPINFHVKTKEYGFGAPFKDKVVRLIGVVFKQPIGENEIGADIRVNMGYQHYGVEYQLNSVEVTESLIYGRNWALRWGYREAIVKMIELTMPSNTYQLDISNSKLNSPITVIAIGFVYEPTDFVTPTLLKDEVLLK